MIRRKAASGARVRDRRIVLWDADIVSSPCVRPCWVRAYRGGVKSRVAAVKERRLQTVQRGAAAGSGS